MAVAFRSDADVTNGTAGTSVTVAKPSGIVDTGDNPGRDQLIAVIAAAGAPTITPPADWVLIDSVASGSAVTMWVYRKLASSEGADWTWTLGSSLRNWGWVGAYTGVDPTSPVYNSSEISSLTASLSLINAGVVTQSGGYIMTAAATRTASGAATTWTVTDDDGLTANERADLSTNAGAGTDISGAVADVAWPQFYLGVLTSTATASQTQTAGVSEMVMLRPYFVPYDATVNGTGTVVEMAFDVDPDGDSGDFTYTDTTAFLHEPARLTIRHGLGNRATVADPGELRFTLLNLNGEWTSPTGTYYGKIVENLPIRVRLNGFGVGVGEGGYHRGTFFLASAQPRWDTSANFAVVDIVANGRLRRLQRRDEPLKSAAYTVLQRMPSTAGFARPVAHFPFEDESDATFAASAISGVNPAITANVTFAASTIVTGASALATISSTSSIRADLPAYTSTGTWTVMFATMVPSEPSVEFGLLGWYTTGTAAIWQVTLAPGAPSAIHLRAYNAAGTSILDTSVTVDEATFYGAARFICATATQSGTGISYDLEVYTATGGSGSTGTLAANTAGSVTRFNLSPQTGTVSGTVLGHIALHVEPGATGQFSTAAVLSANTGESPWARFQRLCQEQAVPYTMDMSDNTDLEMGPQTIAAFMTLIRECETVEGCVLHDSGTVGAETGVLTFPARDDRDNITAQLTLDVDLGQVAPTFQPILDDQDTVNDVEVSRSGGSSARVTGEASIAKKGRTKQLVTVNTETDQFLADLAGWRVNLGTVPGMRFPSVTWNLRRSPELAEAWVTMTLFQRLDILNPPSQYPPDDIPTILEGYTETISSDTWTVTANLSPYQPNHVMVMAETSGDTGEFLGRLTGDPDCALRTAIDSDDTAIVFDPNAFRWTTTADDFPLDVRLGGEVVTLSTIATTAATYVAAGAMSSADNAAVTPALYAGATANDVILILARIRAASAGTLTTPTGYTRLPLGTWTASDEMQLYAKVHSGSESNPTVTPTGGSAGDTVSAVTFGLRNMPITLDDLADLVVDSGAMTNASAQDIAYPGLSVRRNGAAIHGCVVLLLGGKDDDWTSVATVSGTTEALDSSTTTGSDQGLVIDYVIQTTATAVGHGSFTVTGGASAVSSGASVALAGGYQTGTASARSVNGTVKSHTVGTLIEVEDPGVLGL